MSTFITTVHVSRTLIHMPLMFFKKSLYSWFKPTGKQYFIHFPFLQSLGKRLNIQRSSYFRLWHIRILLWKMKTSRHRGSIQRHATGSSVQTDNSWTKNTKKQTGFGTENEEQLKTTKPHSKVSSNGQQTCPIHCSCLVLVNPHLLWD